MSDNPIEPQGIANEDAVSVEIAIGEEGAQLSLLHDNNNDGIVDVMESVIVNDRGCISVVAADLDGDGSMDVMAVDADGDGTVDSVAVGSCAVDTDGDGVPDVIASPDNCDQVWGDVAQNASNSDEQPETTDTDRSMGLGMNKTVRDAMGNVIGQLTTDINGNTIMRDAMGRVISHSTTDMIGNTIVRDAMGRVKNQIS